MSFDAAQSFVAFLGGRRLSCQILLFFRELCSESNQAILISMKKYICHFYATYNNGWIDDKPVSIHIYSINSRFRTTNLVQNQGRQQKILAPVRNLTHLWQHIPVGHWWADGGNWWPVSALQGPSVTCYQGSHVWPIATEASMMMFLKAPVRCRVWRKYMAWMGPRENLQRPVLGVQATLITVALWTEQYMVILIFLYFIFFYIFF